MPKKLHQALEKSAKAKGYTGKKKDRYVYGGMQNAKAKGKGKSSSSSKKKKR